jgi:hypothetical protein
MPEEWNMLINFPLISFEINAYISLAYGEAFFLHFRHLIRENGKYVPEALGLNRLKKFWRG